MAAKVREKHVKFSKKELFDEYFGEMRCLACVSTTQPYQFAHYMNVLLDRNFRLELDSMHDKDGVLYKIYSDMDPVRHIDYNIICNRNRTEFLIPELPNSDYLILMNGMLGHESLYQEIAQLMLQHKKISYSYDFDPMKLKSKEYLVL